MRFSYAFNTRLLFQKHFLTFQKPNNGLILRYDQEMTSYAMDVVNLNSILNLFDEFTNANDTNSSTKENIIHRVGTVESENFSNMLLKTFKDFGLKEVSNLYSINRLQQQII